MKYFKTVEVDLSPFFEEGLKVTLREPTTGEIKTFFHVQKAYSNLSGSVESVDMDKFIEVMEEVGGILPGLIVDHNFYKEDKPTEKETRENVAKLIADKFDAISFISGQIMSILPLPRGSVRK